MFSKVRDRIAELDLVLNLATIISDFESAIIPAMRHLLPAFQHHGCYFYHMTGTKNWDYKQPTRWNCLLYTAVAGYYLVSIFIYSCKAILILHEAGYITYFYSYQRYPTHTVVAGYYLVSIYYSYKANLILHEAGYNNITQISYTVK